jgi:hypothetical protein
MTTILTIIKFLSKIPDFFNIFKHIRGWYINWKVKRDKKKLDHAHNKAQDEKDTRDLQKEIGKHLS